MELGIKGKSALVTAAGRGIGRSIAKSLASEGARVAVCSRTESDITSLLDEMGGTAKGHCGRQVDLEAEDGPQTLMAMLTEAGFGPVDIAVHNLGGTLSITDPYCSLEDWRRVYRINFEVAVELNLLLLPSMMEKGWGRVVHIASTASVENNGPITYCSAKAALAAYSRSLGRILAPEGVVMTAVLPGAVLTEGGHWETAKKERPEHVERYVADRLPLGEFGTPEHIAGIVAFLCSDQAGFFQGSVVPVDGGQIRSFLA